MAYKQEWLVLRNGSLWSDRFGSEVLAKAHIEECVSEGYGEVGDFEVAEMTYEEIQKYYNQ